MKPYQPACTLAEHNQLNRTDLLAQLEAAYRNDPQNEPEACRLIRKHCAGDGQYLTPNFEIAHGVQPSLPLQFAEALFVLRNENGDRLKSPDVLRTLQTHRKDLRLDSRFRFWLGFQAAEEFFNTTQAFTHLSMNIPAYAASSPYFSARFGQGLELVRQAFPGKGLIGEMLEHQPWNDAQRTTMTQLKDKGIGWAVDDYGAPDGHHSPRSLMLAAEYSRFLPPLVKIDGGLTTTCLARGDFNPLAQRLAEVEQHAPNALLVFEWVQSAADVQRINTEMQRAGITKCISYVQSHGFNAAEQKKALALIP